MAAGIKDEHILRLLSHGDVSSNELFYHTPCLTKYTNQYNSFLSTNNIDPTNDTWIKELVRNKIILYIRDTELARAGTVFMVGELEAMSVAMLDGHGIVWSTNVSRFSELLLARVSSVTQRVVRQQVERVF